MIRDGIHPYVWHRPTVVRVQRCFQDNRPYDDADGITCFNLGTIWCTRPGDRLEPPRAPVSRTTLQRNWKETNYRLVVEMDSSGDGKARGRPNGAVWVVNDSSCEPKSVKRGRKTQLEKVLLARITDSLSDLVDCKKLGTWPKFVEAEADHLHYYPCYQREAGGPIEWKHAVDDDCY